MCFARERGILCACVGGGVGLGGERESERERETEKETNIVFCERERERESESHYGSLNEIYYCGWLFNRGSKSNLIMNPLEIRIISNLSRHWPTAVAQLLEHSTTDHKIKGSDPASPCLLG